MAFLYPQHSARRRIVGAFCIVVASAIPAIAQASIHLTPDAITAYEHASEGERVRSLIELAKSEHAEIAAELLDNYPLQGAHAANRTLYIEGLILRSQHQLPFAVAKFRAALANDPSLTLVRADLVETLYAMGETDGARHNLERLEQDAPSQAEALGIRSFINSLDANKPYKFSAYVMAAPTSNINSGTSTKKIYLPSAHKYIEVDSTTKRKSAIGAAAGGSAAYIASIGPQLQAIIAGGAEARIYDKKDYNSLGTSESLELRHLADWGMIGIGAVSSQGFAVDAKELSSVSWGPRASVSYKVAPHDTIDLETLYEWTDYSHSIADDSQEWSTDISWTHGFNSALSLSFYGSYDLVNKNYNPLSYDVWSGGASVYREFAHGITMDLGSELRFIGFDEQNAAAQKFRKDVRSVTTIGITKRDFEIFGMAPALQYTFVWNNSNIALYDFTSHSIDFKLTHEF
jgi:outer membrane protein